MLVNINLRVTPFGQIVFEMGKPTPPAEMHPIAPTHEKVHYHEPLETASRIYEVQYQEELTNYIVPLSTA